MDERCTWINEGDGEFITGCLNEHHFGGLYAPCDLEDIIQSLVFVYCPYCGKKIDFKEGELNG